MMIYFRSLILIFSLALGTPGCVQKLLNPPEKESETNIDAQAVGQTIQRHNAEFQVCYEKDFESRSTPPTVDVKTQFAILPDGQVAQASLKESTFTYAALEECVIDALRSIKDFPKTLGGKVAHVDYPFHFGPHQS